MKPTIFPDRAREMYSAELRRSMIRTVYQKIRKPRLTLQNIKKVRKHCYRILIRHSPGLQPENLFPWVTDDNAPPSELIGPAGELPGTRPESVLNDETPYPFKDELAALFFELVHFFSRIYDLYGEKLCKLLTAGKKGILPLASLHRSCADAEETHGQF